MSRYNPKRTLNVSLEDNTIQAEATAPVKEETQHEETPKVDKDVLVDTPVEKLDSSKSPEALSTHVQAEIEKVKEGETDVDNAVESAEKIINISTEAIAIVEKQGYLDRVSAQLLQISLEQAVAKLPEDSRELSHVSLESFDNSNKYSATVVSMEGVMDTLSTAMNNVVLSAQKHAKNFFGMLAAYTPLLERLKKRAETIRASVDNSRREDGLKEIKFARVENLVIDGKVPEPATLIKNVSYWKDCLNEILSTDAEDRIIDFISKSVDALSRGKKDDKDFDFDNLTIKEGLTIDAVTRPDIFKLFPTIAKTNAAGVHGWTDDSFEFKKSLPLMGNVNIVLYQHRPNPKTDKVRVEWAPGFEFERERGYTGDKTITALTSKQQTEVLNMVIGEIDVVLGYWKGYKARNEKVMRMFQDTHKTYREVKSGAGWLSMQRGVANELKGLATAYKFTCISFRTSAASNLKGISSTLIDYVDASRKATQANLAGQD